MVDLDDLEVYQRLDRDGMRQHLRQLPQECLRAWQQVLHFSLPQGYEKVNKAIVLGMGGSAIGGDLARTLVLLESQRPVWVQRDYDLPRFGDSRTLVIASSYSGNTAETLAAFRASLPTHAKKLALTSGGELKALAQEKGIPVFLIDYPAPPRAAFAHSFFPLVGIFQELGWLKDKSAEIEPVVRLLKSLVARYEETSPSAHNLAKQLAQKLQVYLPVIYSGGFLGEVARRWKTQLNENSKSWAFYDIVPELFHNSVVGYEYPSWIAPKVLVILLFSPAFPPYLLQRYHLLDELLTQRGIEHQIVEAVGESSLAQMMSLVLLGDYVSYYLAILNQTDPSPVKVIEYLKKRL